MRATEIKVGRWYSTKHGIGQIEDGPRTFPVSVRVHIYLPFPLGLRCLSPREVLEEIEAPSPLPAGAKPAPKV